MMELMIAAGKAVAQLQIEHGVAVERVYTGSFMTSLDMAGSYGTATLSCSSVEFFWACGGAASLIIAWLTADSAFYCADSVFHLHVPRTHFYQPDFLFKLRLNEKFWNVIAKEFS